MARVKAMGLSSMFVLLVAVIILLPMAIKFIARMTGEHYMISGFRDMEEEVAVPAGANAMKQSRYVPDINTDYLCRSPNGEGVPCPEGTFCDGFDQSCKPNYVGGTVPDVGYFS